MLNPIKRILTFNRDAGLLDKPYDDFLESSFQIEEALEGLQPQFIVAGMFNEIQEDFEGDSTSPKDVARLITSMAITSDLTTDLDGTVAVTKAVLPNTPYWDDSEWSKALDIAISEGDDYIRDGDGCLFKIIDRNSVKNVVHPITDVDRLDKACDAIVYAVGSIAKLGLSAQQVTQALNIVMDANQAKLGCPKDEFGKLMKPANFPNPEPRLQALLDQR